MKGLFTKSGLQRHKNEKSVVRNVSGAVLEKHASGSSEDFWLNDPIGSGLKSTQQIPIDWSDFAQHVFFNSAEAKVNMAFDEIINGYPFDGTSVEKIKFLSNIGGFTKHVLDQINTNLGYIVLNGTQYIEEADITGTLSPELSRSVGASVISKNLHLKGTTVEFWIKKTNPNSLLTKPALIYQKKKNPASSEYTTKQGITVWCSQSGTSSSIDINFNLGATTTGVNDQLTISSTTIQQIFGGNNVVITLVSGTSSTAISSAGTANLQVTSGSFSLSEFTEKLAELLNQIPGYTTNLSGNILTMSANYVGSHSNLTAVANSWTSTAPTIPAAVNASLSATASQELHFLISSDDFKSITISTDATGDASIPYGEWKHVAISYERGTTERISLYIDGVLRKTTTNTQAELDDIQLADGIFRIGGSSNGKNTIHTSYAADPGPLNNFVGYIDEFRAWLGVRTSTDIKEKYQKNVDATPELLVNYRFNEPPTTSAINYNAKSVVLDYSGNSYHAEIQGYSDSAREGTQGGQTSPVYLEKNGDNPILFPDWATTRELNKNLVISGNHYDRNNPNLITKLIPDHYFEEAQYFEGIEKDFENPEQVEVEGVNKPLPGNSKLPPRIVMLSFLLVWANHFDDVKLYIDSLSLLNKVTYDTYNQIPSHVITFMSDYYGIELPNPYSTETVAKYKHGESIEADTSYGTPLSKTLDRMWRRVLVNLPHLLRSRGTIQGIKSLINTLGIEADSVFRFREFGGAVTKQIATARIKKKKRSQFIDFSKINYIKSENPLWAYRHEPGAPDPDSAPVASEILFQSGDITIVKPATAPQPTTFMSGSWTWEGRYKLLPTELTSSLFRIERTDTNQDVLINLVAMRADESNAQYAGPDYTLKLFVDGYKSSSDPVTLELKGVNLWDDRPWYISVSNLYAATGNTDPQAQIHVNCIQHQNSYIEQHHSGSITYTHTSAAKAGSMLHNGIPLFEIDETSPASTLNYYVGKDTAVSYNTVYNQGTHGATLNYSGKLSHMRMWTKFLEKQEHIEHAFNPFSVHIKNPVNSSAFPGANQTFLNSSNKYETIPLGKISTKFDGTLPEGSWARLRQHFDMYQTPNTLPSSANMLLSSSIPFSDNAVIYGVAGNQALFKEEFIYSLAPPDFDSNSNENKIRIRSFADKATADLAGVKHGTLTKLPFETGIDDRRFSIESSLVSALNEDIVNMMGDSSIMNNYLGAPELEYAVEYPEVKKMMDLYFQRLTGKVNYNAILEFQRWFNNNFATLVEQFIPHTADFLGINFVIESHMLERHKMEYKQGDVHVDIRDRQAFSQEPLFLGTIRSEIT